MEHRKITLPAASPTRCVVLEILRNHHETMVGDERDRPGMDRVRVRLPSGDVTVMDVWSRGEQDIAVAPRVIDVWDAGEILVWAAERISILPAEAAAG